MKIKRPYYSHTIFYVLLACVVSQGQAQVTNLTHPNTYATIQDAINGAVTNDHLQIDAGTFGENVTVNTSIVLTGSGSSTIITPSSGNGITVSSSGVTITNLRITGASNRGIYASRFSTLVLNGVVCDADNIGVELDNVSGVTVNGCTFSNNNDFGFLCNSGQNYSVRLRRYLVSI